MATVTTAIPTTLFAIAATQLGNALLWWQIARLNGLSDPSVPADTVLAMPAAGAPDNDGLPPQ